MATLLCASAPSQDLAFTNCVFLNPKDHSLLGGEHETLYLHLCSTSAYSANVDGLVFVARANEKMQPGTVGLNAIQRRGLGVSNGDNMGSTVYSHPAGEAQVLSAVSLEIDFLVKQKARGEEQMDGAALIELVLSRFDGHYVTKNQNIAIDFQGQNLNLRVTVLEPLVLEGTAGGTPIRAMLTKQTDVNLATIGGSPLKLTGLENKQQNAIFKQDWSFEQMGIGGLDQEFSSIFRRAFASRIFPSAVIKKLGVKHVKGMLLFGPPGTGKTLIARQIGKMLNGKEPKVVNGPEVLSKYVGESEENIRKLFADADAEYSARGDDSELHIIIFDEIDSVCKARGSSRDGTGVHDTVVNQLLSKIDGVNALNNILLIGMTNRKDMIDEALLRPGRLEVHVEISLPDEDGRLQILSIHTASMRESNYLAPDVSLPELASKTKNFSGAEIEGLVKSASSFAFSRQVKVDNMKSVDIDNLKVMQQDFVRALEEVKPAFGVSSADLDNCVRGGIVDCGGQCAQLIKSARDHIQQLRSSERTSLLTVLLEGDSGAGKTAIAAQLALQSDFPFIKLVSPNTLLGMNESSKAQAIAKVFDDAHKSPLSVILLDDLERLIEYVRIGPRFSNIVLQTLLTCCKKQPSNGKLVVLATTSCSRVIEELELLDVFNVQLSVPALRVSEAMTFLQRLGIANASVVQPALAAISGGIPVKKLLLVVEMSIDKGLNLDPGRFTQTLQESGLLMR